MKDLLKLRFVLTVFTLSFILPAGSSAQNVDITKKLKGFDQAIEKILRDWNVPGCGIGIVVKDKLIFAKGYGYRNMEKKLPVTSSTLFQIASNTKLFTATSVGFLVEEGKLDWDKPIKKYVPQIEFYNDELNANVTIRDMLSHRTGISRHDNIWYKSDFTRQQLFDRIKYLEPSIPLRQGYLYNNLMYAASGQIVEILSGQTWEEFVRNRIFTPLNMSHSMFVVEDMQKQPDYMTPYYEKRDTNILLPYPFYTKQQGLGPAGAIISSIDDLSNWLIVQMNDGKFNGKLVIPSSIIKETMQPAIPSSSVPGKYYENLNSIYGMGRSTSSYKGHYRTQHGGAIGGIYSNISFMPADSIGVIVFTNGAHASSLPGIITNIVYDKLLGLSETQWSERNLKDYLKSKQTDKEARKKPDSDRIAGTKPSHPLADYAGIYEDPAYGTMEITLNQRGVNITRCKPVDRQCMDDPGGHGFVSRTGKSLLDTGFEHLAAIDDRFDIRHSPERRILAQRRPVAVIGDDPGPVAGHVLPEELLHGQGQGLEHLALFHSGDPLECIDVVRMHGEEAHELVHALVHATVELGEGGQVLPDFYLLFGSLFKQALGHHELDILAGDEDLFESILHPADTVGHEGKPGAVEDGFLNSGNEAEPQILADFADLAQEVEI